MKTRMVTDEALDHLAVDDPSAVRSRRDLQRIHRWMGTRGILARALRGLFAATPPQHAPLRILELGAGDGSLMLGVARALKPANRAVELTLLDRQPLLSRDTVARYAALGWHAKAQVDDVFDWAADRPTPRHWDVVLANLFLHHFDDAPLAGLLGAVAARTDCFVACEPRRDRLALAASHLVGAIGANAVTRQDAVLSVRAGFSGQEISALWPGAAADWTLGESRAGLFSHCFSAQRLEMERENA